MRFYHGFLLVSDHIFFKRDCKENVFTHWENEHIMGFFALWAFICRVKVFLRKKSLFTEGTGKGSFPRVSCFQMVLQAPGLNKRFHTEKTVVWFHACMPFHVKLKKILFEEWLGTQITMLVFLSSVNCHLFLQVIWSTERLCAVDTFIGFLFTVNYHMCIQFVRPCKTLSTLSTLVGLISCMNFHMCLQFV